MRRPKSHPLFLLKCHLIRDGWIFAQSTVAEKLQHNLEWLVVGPEDNVRDLPQPVGQPSEERIGTEEKEMEKACKRVQIIRHDRFVKIDQNASEGDATRTNPWFHSAWMKGPIRTTAYMSLSWIILKNLTMS